MTAQHSSAPGPTCGLSLLVLALGWAPTLAVALGLGPVVQQSMLGQPLRLVVPIIAAPGDEISGDCFRLATAPLDADGVLQIVQARVALERTAAGARLVVTTARAINEPVIRVALQAGCDNSVRRDYTLLLDPAPIDPPVVVVDAPRPTEPVAATASTEAAAPVSAAPPAGRAATRRQGAAAGAGARQRSAAPQAADGSGQAERPPRAKTKPARATASKRKPPAAAPAPALSGDRLRISGPVAATPPATLPGTGAGAPSVTEVKAQQDLALALEAETVVLRQRVTELSGMIERMEQEMRAATAARLAAEEAAKATPPAIIARWWEANWPFIAAILGLAAVIAGGLLWRRRRVPMAAGEWPITGVRSHSFEPSAIADAAPGTFTQTGNDADPRAGAPIPPGATRRAAGKPDVGQAVAVSELSQVTEEARVYLALDRPDRAIDVLRQHIDEQPKTIPAAWLMLLDLYRNNGRELDFRQLAQEFHLHFNVQTPHWETFDAHPPEDIGLEGFPHLVEQLSAIWGTEDCRSFLERLLYDNRQGRRIGFSLATYDDILTLRQLLELLLVDSDSHEEAKLRAAWAAAQSDAAPPKPGAPRPLDLELDLDEIVDSSPFELTPKAPRRR